MDITGDDDLTWLDWDDDDDDAAPDGSSSCPRVKSAFHRDALIVDGAVQGRLCSMLVDSGSAVTLLSEWFITVELGYELDVLLALRQSEDIIGPSGEPLELVGALETDLVFREMDCRQSVWVVRGLECDCLVGRDVLLGCKIISDDAVFSTLCIACTAESDVFGCRHTRSLRMMIQIGLIRRLEAEDQPGAQLVHVPFDRGRFLHLCLYFFPLLFFLFNPMPFLDFQIYFLFPFLIFFLVLALHFSETWGHVFQREGVVWEGMLPEYTLWQTAQIQLTPGRLV